MKKETQSLVAPLLSLFIFNLGVGFIATLVPVLLHAENASPMMIGLMSTANYIGLFIGSFRAEKFIMRVGHIRAFSAFASCLTCATLLHGMFPKPEVWLILRFVCGICLSGLFVSIESWLLSGSEVKSRGRILALYMAALYAAQASGQFLVLLDKTAILFLFALAAIFSAISILPLAMTKTQSPQIEEPTTLSLKSLFASSPSGVAGCFSAGIIMGSMYGLYPLFIVQKMPQDTELVSYYMAALIFGGMLLQYPVGKASDTIERRTVLGIVFFLSAFICGALALFYDNTLVGITLSFLVGGFTFTIYPICIAHACDTLETKDLVSATQGLLLVYSVGAALGPFISSGLMKLCGSNGLMGFMVFVAIITGSFLFYRRANTAPSIQEGHFLPSPQTSTVVAEIDPRSDQPESA